MHPSIVMTRVEYFLAANLAGGGFDTTALKDLDLLDAGVKRCLCKLHVSKSMSNRYGTLHGGCIATLVDVVGSAAIVTISDRGGVSLGINTLYLNPMPSGEDVLIDAHVIKMGKDIATVEVLLKRESTGDIVAHGTHVKKLVSASDLSPLFRFMEQQQQQQQQLGKQQQQTQQERWQQLKKQWQQASGLPEQRHAATNDEQQRTQQQSMQPDKAKQLLQQQQQQQQQQQGSLPRSRL